MIWLCCNHLCHGFHHEYIKENYMVGLNKVSSKQFRNRNVIFFEVTSGFIHYNHLPDECL
jgi:hypothetical protein